MSYGKLIIPEGKKSGCLMRKSKVGAICPMAADRIDTIDRDDWQQFIDQSIGLSDGAEHIFDQDGIGSCATESTSQGVMLVERLSEGKYELLNPWFIYYHTSGGRDRGSSIDENLEFVRDRGIAPDSVWPRYDEQGKVINNWDDKPSEEAYEAALPHRIDEFYDVTSILEVGSCLCSGIPVIFGWDGHSCILTKLMSKTHAEYVNSWARSWGDEGRGLIPLSSINFSYGAFGIRSAIY